MTYYLLCEDNGYARFVDSWARLRCTNFVLAVHSDLRGGDGNSKETSKFERF